MIEALQSPVEGGIVELLITPRSSCKFYCAAAGETLTLAAVGTLVLGNVETAPRLVVLPRLLLLFVEIDGIVAGRIRVFQYPESSFERMYA